MINIGDYLDENIKMHATTAWRGYQSEGRGAVVAKIHFADNDDNAVVIGQSLGYLSEITRRKKSAVVGLSHWLMKSGATTRKRK